MKTWRMSEKDFLDKVAEFIEKEYPASKEKIQGEVDSIGKNVQFKNDGIRERSIALMNAQYMEGKPNQHSKSVLESKLKLMSLDSYWFSEWSLRPHTPEEIVLAVLINTYFNLHLVSITYICRANYLTADIIEDLMFITSELFSFDAWNDACVEFTCNILKEGTGYDCSEILNAFIKSNTKDKDYKALKKTISDMVEKAKEEASYSLDAKEKSLLASHANVERLNRELAIMDEEENLVKKYIKESRFNPERATNEEFKRFATGLFSYIEMNVSEYRSSFWMNMSYRCLSKRSRNNEYANSRIYRFITDSILELLDKARSKTVTKITNIKYSMQRTQTIIDNIVAGKDETASMRLSDRLDWGVLRDYQDLPKTFMEKYDKLFPFKGSTDPI